MTRLQPLSPQEIVDADLREAVEQSEAHGLPGEWLTRVVARVPNQGSALVRLLRAIDEPRGLPVRTKLMVGVLLADRAEDQYTKSLYLRAARVEGIDPDEMLEAALSDYDTDDHVSGAEQVALAFAEQMFLDASKIDDAFFDDLKRFYDDAQIMELGTFCGVRYALSVLMAALDAPASPKSASVNFQSD